MKVSIDFKILMVNPCENGVKIYKPRTVAMLKGRKKSQQ